MSALGHWFRGWVEEPEVRVIEPRPVGIVHRLPEFWRYRRLVFYFGRQMIEKLYRRTWLGAAWIPLRPVITVASSTLVFGGLLGVSSGTVPYALFFLFTTAVWDLFAYTLQWGTRSLDLGKRVLRRMYVPRLTVLVGSLMISFTYFAIYAVLAVIGVGYYLIVDGTFYLQIGMETLLVPVAIVLLLLMALGVACFTSPYAMLARDVRFGVAYVLGFWMLLSPVVYPLSHVPDSYRILMEINPVTAPLEMFRIGVFGEGQVPTLALISSLTITTVTSIGGLIFFARREEQSLDGV